MSGKKMTRRAAIALGAAAGAGALGYACLSGGSDSYATDPGRWPSSGPFPVNRKSGFRGPRPNIVMILCDDLGMGDLGCYGNRLLRTPNIDALARRGVRFTDFYASASLCTPSRAGLLTGRFAVRSGLTFPIQAGGRPFVAKALHAVGMSLGRLGIFDLTNLSSSDGLPSDEITIARALKTAGYRNMAIGKWHLGDFSCDAQYHPLRHGFDEFFGTPMTNDELPNPLYRNETMLENDIGLNQARLTGLSTREAVRFIESSDGNEPFFLYLAYHAPHLPLYASERFRDKSGAGIYGDVVEELDWGIGEVMNSLRQRGLDDNTIVIFTSDNGPWYSGNPGDALRGRKGESFEGGFRAPLIVRWPRKAAPGSVCAAPSMNIDLFPTLLSAAGLTLPFDRIIDGKDITGLITGRERQSPHEVLYFYHHEILEGVRSGNWKYFRNMNHYTWPFPVDRPTTPIGSLIKDRFLGTWPNLYNIATDRGENYDLASRYPDTCRRMEALMNAWDNAMRENPRGWIAAEAAAGLN